MTLEREVLPDRTEARQERLRAPGQAETTHTSLAFTRGLMAVLCTVVDAGGRLDEHVLHVRQLWDFGLCCGVTAQLVSDDLLRHLGTGRQYTFEETFRGGLVAPLL
ncbi:hypothetical protein OKW35_003306 [Paraburkholderia sp. MM5477-R1]